MATKQIFEPKYLNLVFCKTLYDIHLNDNKPRLEEEKSLSRKERLLSYLDSNKKRIEIQSHPSDCPFFVLIFRRISGKSILISLFLTVKWHDWVHKKEISTKIEIQIEVSTLLDTKSVKNHCIYTQIFPGGQSVEYCKNFLKRTNWGIRL